MFRMRAFRICCALVLGVALAHGQEKPALTRRQGTVLARDSYVRQK